VNPVILSFFLPCMSVVVQGGASETVAYSCPNTAHFFLMESPSERYKPAYYPFDMVRDDRAPAQPQAAVVPQEVKAAPVVKVPAKKVRKAAKKAKKRKKKKRA
jgi:hypothetical protein